MKRTLSALLLACCAGGASGASFDCRKATSSTEKLICSDPDVSALDEALNAAYRTAMGRIGDKAVLRQSQRDWLASSDVAACSAAACLKAAFTSRITVLADVAGPGEPGAAWTGRYERVWRGKKDPDSAELTMLGLKTGRVLVSGTALWLGPNASNGQVNTGELAGYAETQSGGRTLRFDTDGCMANFHTQGGRLVVKDESGCGGSNVTFNGEYLRTKPR